MTTGSSVQAQQYHSKCSSELYRLDRVLLPMHTELKRGLQINFFSFAKIVVQSHHQQQQTMIQEEAQSSDKHATHKSATTNDFA
eukprot:1201268-Amphidinium_carterae.1